MTDVALSDRERAHALARRTRKFIEHLSRENSELKQRVHTLEVAPLPDVKDDPGYEMWRALMEDLCESGQVHLQVRHKTVIEIGYEAAT